MNKKLIILLCPLVFALGTIQDGNSQKSSVPDTSEIAIPDEPIEYTVSVLLNRIGEIDEETGTYELDFWLTIRSDEMNFLEDPPKIDFVNGKIEMVSSEFTTSNYYEAFIQGKFYNEMDYHDFPFEKLWLTMEIEPSAPFTHNIITMTADDEQSGIDSKARIPGWIVDDESFIVETHSYAKQGDFSRFIASYVAERSELGSFLKTMSPVLIIVGISLYSFWVPENFTLRIYLIMPTLIALVFWHINTLNNLPTLGYLTIFDKMMVSVYALYVNSITSLVIQARLVNRQQHDAAKRANKIMRNLIPIIGFGVFFILDYMIF